MGVGDRFAQLGESPEAVMGLMSLLAGSQARYDDHRAALDRAHADQMRAYDAHAAMNRALVGADDAAAGRHDRMAADTQPALADLAQHGRPRLHRPCAFLRARMRPVASGVPLWNEPNTTSQGTSAVP